MANGRLAVRRAKSVGMGVAVVTIAATAMADHSLPTADDPAARHTYYSNGVHNDVGCATPTSCVYPRKHGEPPKNPQYPGFWISDWTMYRVFRRYKEYPPPYASPPAGLTPADYEVSYGATYYDSTYVPPDRDGEGAMLEYYDKRCLPIFPGSNQFSCAFVSLGNKAYFLRYDDRPAGTAPCCQFSLDNHPPRTDFIKHLPYSAAPSASPCATSGRSRRRMLRPRLFHRRSACASAPRSNPTSCFPTTRTPR